MAENNREKLVNIPQTRQRNENENHLILKVIVCFVERLALKMKKSRLNAILELLEPWRLRKTLILGVEIGVTNGQKMYFQGYNGRSGSC